MQTCHQFSELDNNSAIWTNRCLNGPHLNDLYLLHGALAQIAG